MTTNIDISQFNYHLPEELIAQTPSTDRTDSRLLHLCSNGVIHDKKFNDLINLINKNDLLVFNNTKVIKARLHGHKQSGGRAEILIERILSNKTALAHIRSSKSPKPNSKLIVQEDVHITVLGREGELFLISFEKDVLDILDSYGAMPLPPYISRQAQKIDDQRYQTVYASKLGAVAAPTAGLHFDQQSLQQLNDKGVQQCFVTLHVGAGTFQPVRVQNIKDHIMHCEFFSVDADIMQKIEETKKNGGRVIAVGTTSARALESAANLKATHIENTEVDKDKITGDTRLFITPGYQFKVVDALVTNFHLPQSTLLMMVSALASLENIKKAYAHAVEQKYRFFSYGDAMFIESSK